MNEQITTVFVEQPLALLGSANYHGVHKAAPGFAGSAKYFICNKYMVKLFLLHNN